MRPKLYIKTCFNEHFHDLIHRSRACVAIWLRHVVIDHHYTTLITRTIARDKDCLAVGNMETFEFSAPALAKFPLIFDLVGLDTNARIRPMRNPLMVNNDRSRLVYDFVPGLPHLECEIGVFAIGGSVAFVEAAQSNKEIAADQ